MSTETATLILNLIAAVALVGWVAGLTFVIATGRMIASVSHPPDGEARFEPEVDPTVAGDFGAGPTSSAPARGRTTLYGEGLIEGQAARLARRFASRLASSGLAPGFPARVVEAADDRVGFEAPSTVGQPRGVVEFADAGGGRVGTRYRVDVGGTTSLLVGAGVILAAGLLAIVSGYWLVSTYVISLGNPAARVQTIQMLQVVHLIWPPFLLGGIARRRVGVVREALDTTLANLPHLPD